MDMLDGLSKKLPRVREKYIKELKELMDSGKNEAEIANALIKYDNIFKELPYMSTSEIKRINGLAETSNIKQVSNTLDSIIKSRTNSDILRANLKKAGIVSPNYKNNAHHIIPVNDMDTNGFGERSRKILDKFGIDINSADNGVFLPVSDISGGSAINHCKIHTNKYYENVYREIRKCKTDKQVIDKLNKIRNKIFNGTFEY